MKISDKNKKILITLCGLVALVLIIGISSARYVIKKGQDDPAIFASACVQTTYEDDGNIHLGRAYPMLDAEAMDLKPSKVRLSNICGNSLEVTLNLEVLDTTTMQDSSLKLRTDGDYTIEPKVLTDFESAEPTLDNAKSAYTIATIRFQPYEVLEFDLRVWMKDSIGLGEEENKEFHGKFSMTNEEVEREFTLAEQKLLNDNGGYDAIVAKGEPNFSVGSYHNLYEKVSETKESSEVISFYATGNYEFANDYTFDIHSGNFLLSEISKENDKSIQGKYYCAQKNGNDCKKIYKILEGDYLKPGEKYSYWTNPDQYELWYEFGVGEKITTGTGFYVDNEDGLLHLSGVNEQDQINNESIGKYLMADTFTDEGEWLIKILGIEEDPEQEVGFAETIGTFNYSLTSNNNKTVGKSIMKDEEKGTYTLTDIVKNVSYGEEYIGYYTCNNNETTCSYIYKIETVDGTTAKTGQTYSLSYKHWNCVTLIEEYYTDTAKSKITKVEEISGKMTDEIYEEKGMYSTKDGIDEVFYYRGDVQNNNIQFGTYQFDGYMKKYSYDYGFYDSLQACGSGCVQLYKKGDPIYWKIVRTNGDGSLRLLYNGNIPGNNNDKNFVYYGPHEGFHTENQSTIGFMNGHEGNSYESTHDNFSVSSPLGELRDWYNLHIANSDAEKYVYDSYFCNDREPMKSGYPIGNTGLGYGKNITYYKGYERIYENKRPSLFCAQTNDRLTKYNSYGNKAYQNTYIVNPSIGLITADELMYAGLTSNSSLKTKTYADSNFPYYTMTPSHYNNSGYIFAFYQKYLRSYHSGSYMAIRPVININSHIELEGDGTVSNPYRIKGAN